MDQIEKPNPEAPMFVLKGVSKTYGRKNRAFLALKDVSLCLPKTGFVAILGESGSGKTTLLNLMGGLDKPTSGQLYFHGRDLTAASSRELDCYRNRSVGFVFQSYHLIPHETVLGNVMLRLRLSGSSKKEAKEKATRVLTSLGLGDIAKKKPAELSGGQAQRVAIARAIVSSPSVIFADEPTGALDSETSLQIMDLLRELSSSTLVVMVTHNRALAQKYATRTIELKDGSVISDSSPMEGDVPEIPSQPSRAKMRFLSFGAGLSSSFRNIANKKGRTAITSLACSIGVMGVGMVLGVTDGFSSYVHQVESSIASSVPISIAPWIYSVRSSAINPSDKELFPDDDELRVYDTTSDTYVYHQNKFTPEYIEYLRRIENDPSCPAYGSAMSVMFNRANLDFHFLTSDGLTGEHIKKVSQYSWASASAYSVNNYTQLPTYVMHELYGKENELSSLYDVIYGRFPTEASEMVLIVDRFNRVEFSTLRTVGIIPQSTQYADLSSSGKTRFDFSEIVEDFPGDPDCKTYRCYRNSDYFQVGKVAPTVYQRKCYSDVHFSIPLQRFVGEEDEKEFQCYVNAEYANENNPYDRVYQDESYSPIECKIVGVIRPTEESYLQLMPSSIGYTPALTELMYRDYEEGGKGQILASTEEKSWYVPRLYESDGVTKSASDGLEILNTKVLPLIQDLSNKNVSELTSILTSKYLTSALEGAVVFAGASGRQDSLGNRYYPGFTTSVSTYLSWCRTFGTEFDTEEVPSMSLSEESIGAWVSTLFSRDLFELDGAPNIVECLAYMNAYSVISNILVFPSSLTTKDTLRSYLNAWNEGKADADQVTYADIMTDVTGGLNGLIKVISVVLILFASISLVIGAALTAIVTYISVMERKEEIGILRSCGGRKLDVAFLFESETFFIGISSGIVGVLLTLMLCSPLNSFLKTAFPTYVMTDIAHLTPFYGVMLIAGSVVLGLLSGLIPALIAARKDPVACLRSE
ncbi:MAG: ABC transporter ATP-binding protein/permease [Candidatus Enteromonas sp.]|nr:ABC transporter ATP-binding protein/permease [Candidatus Enteromonas sp.]